MEKMEGLADGNMEMVADGGEPDGKESGGRPF